MLDKMQVPEFGLGEGDNKLTYDDEVAAIIANTTQVHEEWWWDIYDFIRKSATPPKLFVLFALVACVCMILFAISLQHTEQKCIIFDPEARCCICLFDNATAVDTSTNLRTTLYYSTLMMVSAGFGSYHAIRGVQTENRFHLMCFACTMGLFVGRSTIMLLYGLGDNETTVLVFLILGLMSTGLACLLIYPTYKQFGWRLFRKSGAKKHMREMYKTYEKFMAFVRLDMQFHTLVFMLCGFYQNRDRIWIVAMFAITSYAWNLMIHHVAKNELRTPFLLWMTFMALTPVWWSMTWWDYSTCYRDFGVSRRAYHYNATHYEPPSYYGQDCLAPEVQHDRYVYEGFIVVFCNAFFFRTLLLFFGWQVLRNFNNGLKEQMNVEGEREKEESRSTSSLSMNTVQKSGKGKGLEEALRRDVEMEDE